MTPAPEVSCRARSRSPGWFLLALLFHCMVCAAEDRVYNTSSIVKSSVDWPLDRNGQTWTRLSIPLGYLHGTLIYPSRAIIEQAHQDHPILSVSQAVSLWALWPNMGIPQSTDTEQYGRPGSPIVSMRLGADFAASELPVRAQIGLREARNVCLRPDKAHSRAELKCQDQPLVEKAIEYGLNHIGVETERYPNMYRAGFYHDVYYVSDLEQGLTSFITCSENEPHPFEPEYNGIAAMCEHVFMVNSLHATARVGYGREHLKDWREIEAAWQRQLQAFVVQFQ